MVSLTIHSRMRVEHSVDVFALRCNIVSTLRGRCNFKPIEITVIRSLHNHNITTCAYVSVSLAAPELSF